jgi:hypothetical protein
MTVYKVTLSNRVLLCCYREIYDDIAEMAYFSQEKNSTPLLLIIYYNTQNKSHKFLQPVIEDTHAVLKTEEVSFFPFGHKQQANNL